MKIARVVEYGKLSHQPMASASVFLPLQWQTSWAIKEFSGRLLLEGQGDTGHSLWVKPIMSIKLKEGRKSLRIPNNMAINANRNSYYPYG